MDITVAVFTVWALTQVWGLREKPGLLPHVAGLAFLGYAALYLAHSVIGARVIYIYIFSVFLTVGGILCSAALWSIDSTWALSLTTAAVILYLGTAFHRNRTYRWSRHLYFSSGGAILVSLGLSTLQWSSLPFGLAFTSLLLWTAYIQLADAVGDVRRATTAERALAKYGRFNRIVILIAIVGFVLLCVFGGN